MPDVIVFLRLGGGSPPEVTRIGFAQLEAACRDYVNSLGFTITQVFREIGPSAALRRPVLLSAVDAIKPGDMFLTFTAHMIGRSGSLIDDVMNEVARKGGLFHIASNGMV